MIGMQVSRVYQVPMVVKVCKLKFLPSTDVKTPKHSSFTAVKDAF